MKVGSLKPTKGVRNWCGPVALSILTGRTVGYVSKLLAHDGKAQGYKRTYRPNDVGGVYLGSMRRALEQMGFTFLRQRQYEGLTLFRMAEGMRTNHWRQPLLILAGGHYVVMQRGYIYCSWEPEGAPHDEYVFRRYRVEAVYVISR